MHKLKLIQPKHSQEHDEQKSKIERMKERERRRQNENEVKFEAFKYAANHKNKTKQTLQK